jgi:hypothetical protein
VNVGKGISPARTAWTEADLELGHLRALGLGEDEGLAVERVDQRRPWPEGTRGHGTAPGLGGQTRKSMDEEADVAAVEVVSPLAAASAT